MELGKRICLVLHVSESPPRYEVTLCKECITWATEEKRIFLRQALEARLIGLYFDTGHYQVGWLGCSLPLSNVLKSPVYTAFIKNRPFFVIIEWTIGQSFEFGGKSERLRLLVWGLLPVSFLLRSSPGTRLSVFFLPVL